MRTIKEEADVRAIIRDMVGTENLLTVEYARGGTNGYPDFTILHKRAVHLCELKRGDYVSPKDIGSAGGLKVHFRTGQKIVIRQCYAAGIIVHAIGGEIGTNNLWYSRGIDAIGDGILRRRFNTVGMLHEFLERGAE